MHLAKAKSLLTRWNGMNVYRGCLHGCVYCDSRSACYRFSHPFEDIEVKENAPELLENILQTKRKKFVISSGSMADPYQPCEAQFMLTRQCLALIEQYAFGAAVITKSDLVLRDVDILARINRKAKAVVQMSLTIADGKLGRKLEPHVCDTERRYEVLMELRRHGIPTVVWMTPILPYLTDTRKNIETILQYCIDAEVKGVICFNAGMTLRSGSREYYYQALDRHFPGLSSVYRKQFGDVQEVVSAQNAKLMRFFHETCERYGILHNAEDCFRYVAEMPERNTQATLFDAAAQKRKHGKLR